MFIYVQSGNLSNGRLIRRVKWKSHKERRFENESLSFVDPENTYTFWKGKSSQMLALLSLPLFNIRQPNFVISH